jgi:hypothetical protein
VRVSHATPLPRSVTTSFSNFYLVQRFGSFELAISVVESRVTTSLYYHSWLRSSTPFIFLQRTCPTSTTSPRTLRFQNPKKRVSWSLSRTRSVGEMRLLQLPLRVREVILGVHTRQPPITRRSRAERWRYVNTACLCSSGCGLERRLSSTHLTLHTHHTPTHTHNYPIPHLLQHAPRTRASTRLPSAPRPRPPTTCPRDPRILAARLPKAPGWAARPELGALVSQ